MEERAEGNGTQLFDLGTEVDILFVKSVQTDKSPGSNDPTVLHKAFPQPGEDLWEISPIPCRDIILQTDHELTLEHILLTGSHVKLAGLHLAASPEIHLLPDYLIPRTRQFFA